jgi:PIN domain nuclease of toxin-antitoxin system
MVATSYTTNENLEQVGLVGRLGRAQATALQQMSPSHALSLQLLRLDRQPPSMRPCIAPAETHRVPLCTCDERCGSHPREKRSLFPRLSARRRC